MRGVRVAAWGAAFALLAVVRVLSLHADPPRWLTWSGAVDTDEGFYTLDARHRALFGTDAPGDFHDRALAPLLSWGQQGWYTLFGAGATAARSLDALGSLLCVGVLCWGLHRTAGHRAAAWGAVLLGLCPTFVYYNRLALQETPAALLLTLAWALWTASERGRGWMAFAAGAALTLACGVKSLCVVFLPVALVLAVRGKRRGLLFAGGAIGTAALLTVVWLWPERHTLGTTAAYYSHAQAGAGGAAHVLWNVRRALVGDAMGVRRGLLPCALGFWPALAVLAGLSLRRAALEGRPPRPNSGEQRKRGTLLPPPVLGGRGGQTAVDPFLVAWAACGVLYCLLSSYAPDRYYVLFLPALAGMAAREAVQQHRGVQVLALGVTLMVSGFWLALGLMHPSYARAQASQALAKALPPGATVIGDAAPALCMGTGLRAAPVQFGLSNYADPVAQTGARYIVTGREAMWTRFWAHVEPGACVPGRRLLTVRLASGRVVDVYRAPRGGRADPTPTPP